MGYRVWFHAGRQLRRVLASAFMVMAALAVSAVPASGAGVVEWGILPEPVSGLGEVVEVSAGAFGANAAVLADGTVVSWQHSGEAPQPVAGLSEVAAISGDLALLRDGKVMEVGSGGPVEVSGLSDVVAISEGGEGNAMALLGDGTVKTWGTNVDGELGIGTFEPPEGCSGEACSKTPVTPKGLSEVTAIDAGTNDDLALLANGTVMAWGANEFGQLGDGAGVEFGPSKNEPVPVSGLTGVTAISAGRWVSLATLADGTVEAWGDNEAGQLGDPALPNFRRFQAISRNYPEAVSGLSDVTAISAGGSDNMALLSDGTVVDWGENSGSLGLGIGTATGPELCEYWPENFEKEPVGRKCAKEPVAVHELTEVSVISDSEEGAALAAGPLSERVAKVSPAAGPGSGNTEVTITGTNLGEASEVHFGGNEASAFTVLSPTAIRATAPAGTGDVDVTVRTPAGTTPPSARDKFDYAPTVSEIEPTQGPEAGGTAVTITGTNFTEVSGVEFGTTPATSFKVDSPTSITAESPAGTGSVDVTVATTGGSSPTSAGDVFRYVPQPTVSSLEPTSGPTGTTVTIIGTNLGEVLEVRFGSTPASGIFVRVPGERIAAVAPKGIEAVDVTVRTPGGISPTNPGDVFTYQPSGPPPTVTKVKPNKGPVAGGNTVSISGANLDETVAVYFGSAPATSFAAGPNGSINAVAPAGTVGTVDVTVRAVGGTSTISSKDHYKYEGLAVDSVSPSSGPAAGGTHVTVTGEGFATGAGATQFLFKKTAATEVVCSSITTCTMIAPPGKAGKVDVRAAAAGKKSKVNRPGDQFEYH